MQTATVNLLLNFNTLEAGTLQPQAVPAGASRAVINVYKGNTLIRTLTVEAAGGTVQQSIQLTAGDTYRFETSILNKEGTEIAWGNTERAIQASTTVNLDFRSVIRHVELTGTPFDASNRATVFLDVRTLPGGVTVPHTDFEVTYSVSGGELVSSSKLGAEVQADGSGPVNVTATVMGLSEAQQVVSFTHTLALPFAPAEGARTVQANVQSWPSPLTAQLRARYTSGPISLSGSVDGGGKLNLELPAASNSLEAGFLERYIDYLIGSNEEREQLRYVWTTAPGDLPGIFIAAPQLYSGDAPLGKLEMNVPGQPPVAGFIYVPEDREIRGEGIGGGYVVGIAAVDFQLKAGWNVVFSKVSYYPDGADLVQHDMTSAPLDEVLPMATWTTDLPSMADLALSLTASDPTPDEGGSTDLKVGINHTRGAFGERPVSVQLTLPGSLEFVSASANADCVPSSSTNIVDCSVLLPAGGAAEFTVKTNVKTFAQFPTEPTSVSAAFSDPNFTDGDNKNNSASLQIDRQATAPTNVTLVAEAHQPYLEWYNTYSNDPLYGQPVRLGQKVRLSVRGQDVVVLHVFENANLIATIPVGEFDMATPIEWIATRLGPVRISVVGSNASGNSTTLAFNANVY